jgi:hypothetical protein
MASNKKIGKKLLIALGTLFGFFAVLIISTLLLMKYFDNQERKEVGGEMRGNFPIIIRTDNMVQVVYGEEFEEFKEKNPNYTLLIPIEQKDVYKKQIEENTRAKNMDFNQNSKIPWWATFSVKQIDNQKQSFVVSSTWDDDRENVGEYEASEKEIFPKFHKSYFGPGYAMMSCPMALIFTCGVWVLIGIAAWLRKRNLKIEQ